MPRVRYVALGRIGRPHGVRGEVRVDPGAGPAVDYGRYQRFFLARSGEPRPVQVEGVRPHGRLALFKTVEDVFPTGAHDVLVVASKSGSWMLPVVGETVLEVDPEGGLIRVRVPGGLPA